MRTGGAEVSPVRIGGTMIARRSFLMTLSAAGTIGTLVPRIGASQSLPVVRIASNPIDLYAQPYYAQELGLFKQHGLNVEITTLANGGAVATAVAGGAVDMGVANAVAAANASLRGVPFGIVAGAGMYSTKSPSTAICIPSASPLKNAKDLEGKTIALASIGDLAQVGVELWLQTHGADPSTIKWTEIYHAEMGAALQSGRFDAAMIPEPSLSGALKTGSVKIFFKPFDAIASEFFIGVHVATRDWITKNTDVAKRAVAALNDAGRWANAHHEESAAILAKVGKLDPTMVRGMNRALFTDTLAPTLLQPALDAATKFNLLSRPIRAEDLIIKLS